MTFSAAQIASLIDGKVEGDAETLVGAFEKIEEAQEGQLAFLGNPKYEEYLYTTGASIIIVDDSQQLKQPVNACLIRVPNAYSAFATLLTKYQEMTLLQLTGIENPSFIHASATLGENIFIGAFAYIGENVQIGNKSKIFPNVFLGRNVSVGENTIIHPGVVIYNDCVIKNNVTIHAGTVIGSDGFGFAPQTDTSYKKVPQIGNVIVEDNVEIGANTTIDRATIGSTIIHRGVKLDNLIQVAHNVEIGSNTVVAAQVGISGSTKVGENVMIGGQAGLAGHIQIANGCKINGQSGVSKSIKTPNVAITGTNAYDYASAMKSQAVSRNLPEMERRLRRLEMLLDKSGQ
ncbi:MAG: UDP-3-O-(3-hydroxymyristoyl)glucosamine N-acyltransferase [Chitinophagaceae bacterium]